MTPHADRGKWAENEVEKVLKRMNEMFYKFAYDRQPDARSARGALKASLCDFLWWWEYENGEGGLSRVSGLLEVKETKHDYRLTKDKLDQLARMRKVRNAGGSGIVVVYHSTLDRWRILPIGFLDGPIPPSWDLSSLPLYPNAATAMTTARSFFPYVDPSTIHVSKRKF